jgi:hypothetical protein
MEVQTVLQLHAVLALFVAVDALRVEMACWVEYEVAWAPVNKCAVRQAGTAALHQLGKRWSQVVTSCVFQNISQPLH